MGTFAPQIMIVISAPSVRVILPLRAVIFTFGELYFCFAKVSEGLRLAPLRSIKMPTAGPETFPAGKYITDAKHQYHCEAISLFAKQKISLQELFSETILVRGVIENSEGDENCADGIYDNIKGGGGDADFLENTEGIENHAHGTQHRDPYSP
jgi:hypothetical protein